MPLSSLGYFISRQISSYSTFSNWLESFKALKAQKSETTQFSQQTKPLNLVERLSRAASFYSLALPLFVAYQALDSYIQFQEKWMQRNYTSQEKTALFNKIHDWGSDQIVEKVKELQGYYVKTGQIISTRVDIFPKQYTSKLSVTQDSLNPLPAEVAIKVIEKELLNGAPLSDLFMEFDSIPLGSASIAQVHKARLIDGRYVAIKVQRPGIDAKLLGDIANLKSFAKAIGDSLLIDYYKIFCELEQTLTLELDFLYEALSTAKVAAAVAHTPGNRPQRPPVIVPLPIPGLVTKRVLVLEFIEGKSLSKLSVEMEARGIQPGSIQATILGKRLLSALTDAYGCMIFGSGIIHGDPHPGNIFILPQGRVALLDCGQVKQISLAQRMGLATTVLMVHEWEKLNKQIISGNVDSSVQSALEVKRHELTSKLAQHIRSFGIILKENSSDDCAAAVAILLFGSSDTVLPGGYAGEEISVDSPIVQVSEFPSDVILLGRATVMIRGIANRLGISWGLAERWAKLAKEAVESIDNPLSLMPVWSASLPTIPTPPPPPLWKTKSSRSTMQTNQMLLTREIRLRDVVRGLVSWIELLTKYVSQQLLRMLRFLNVRIIQPCLSVIRQLLPKRYHEQRITNL